MAQMYFDILYPGRLVRVVSATLTPFSSPFVCVLYSFLVCCLNFWTFPLVVPDLSDRRLVRVLSAASTPCPPVPLPGRVPRNKLWLF